MSSSASGHANTEIEKKNVMIVKKPHASTPVNDSSVVFAYAVMDEKVIGADHAETEGKTKRE